MSKIIRVIDGLDNGKDSINLWVKFDSGKEGHQAVSPEEYKEMVFKERLLSKYPDLKEDIVQLAKLIEERVYSDICN